MASEDLRIVISGEARNRMQEVVKVESPQDWNALIIDAINSYIELGRLAANGGTFFLSRKDKDEMVPMKFPFHRDS